MASAADLIAAVASGQGHVLVIEGPAGIGRSRLLEEIADRGQSAGMTVARARGSELECGYPFGVVRQLFEPLLHAASADERSAALAGAARHAEPAVADEEVAVAAPVEYASLHGVYTLASNLADRAPLLLAVDDAHWSDPASLRALAFLARRIGALPVLLALTLRHSEPGVEPDVLEDLRAQPLVTVLRPAPLGAEAAMRVVRDVLGDATPAATCRACFAATLGYPALLRALAEDLAAEGAAALESAAPGVPAVGPGQVSRAVLHRVARLGDDAVRFARAAAVLGDGVERQTIAALAGLDEHRGAAATGALVKAEVLADAEQPTFAQPVLRGAVYGDVDFAHRAEWHRRAAELLHDAGAPPQSLAPHLVHGETFAAPWIGDVLVDAAARARRRGALEDAAAYLERVPGVAERPDLLLELGTLDVQLLRAHGVDRLRRALELAGDAHGRARAGLALGRALALTGQPAAVEALGRALTDAPDDDLRLAIRTELVAAGFIDHAAAAAWGEALTDLVSEAPDAPAVLALGASWCARGGAPRSEALDLARRAVDDERILDDAHGMFLVHAASALMWSDDFDLVRRLLDRAIQRARRRGSALLALIGTCLRSEVALRQGRLADAEADARAALRHSSCCALRGRADALLERVGAEPAAALLDRAGDAAALPATWDSTMLLATQGRVRIATGRLAEGVADLRECGRRLDRAGASNPAVVAWRSSVAPALAELGERDEARRLTASELELARRFGAPRAIGVALRAAGLAEGSTDRLREAVAVLERSGAEVELARALTDLGATIRRQGDAPQARTLLQRALDGAGRAGAGPLVARARDELVAAGARPRRAVVTGPGALTPSERRVARLAMQCRTNREIARVLHVTEKTVELHLRNAYHKLGIRSRTQLAGALGAGERDR